MQKCDETERDSYACHLLVMTERPNQNHPISIKNQKATKQSTMHSHDRCEIGRKAENPKQDLAAGGHRGLSASV